LLRRLTAPVEDLEADLLRDEVRECAAVPIEQASHGDKVVVRGRVRSVVYTPRQNVATLQADLFDGTGVLHLVWLGRRRIAGIEPGRVLQVSGRVSLSPDGLMMYNPNYELRIP
jgi:RecG-like helicase